MKNILFLAAIISGSTSFAQELSVDKVPAAVQNSFKAKFPASEAKGWELENETDFETDFDLNGKKHSAKFDKQGKWIETETEINVSDLPKSINEAVTKNFAGFKIEETEKAETASQGIVYEVKLKKGKEVFEVKFSQEGKILKKETEDDNQEKD